jgi:hypothetical protein
MAKFRLKAAQRAVLSETAAWARQAMAFAIQVRDHETHKRLDDPDTVKAALTEAHKMTENLWESTVSELGSTDDFNDAIVEYVRRVFTWCDKHMSQD